MTSSKTKSKNKIKATPHRFRFFQSKIGGGLWNRYIKADFATGQVWFIERESLRGCTAGRQEVIEITVGQLLFDKKYFECTEECNRAEEYGYMNIKPADLA